jgi:hypothetical protein
LGYRSALFFGVAISFLALILEVGFVRLVIDYCEGWVEEDHMQLNEM